MSSIWFFSASYYVYMHLIGSCQAPRDVRSDEDDHIGRRGLAQGFFAFSFGPHVEGHACAELVQQTMVVAKAATPSGRA
jgi:hypothetical protein